MERLFTLTIWNLKEIGQSNISATETNLICNVSSERFKNYDKDFKKKEYKERGSKHGFYLPEYELQEVQASRLA